ncbi:GNAT family N-acetyltransferase [Propionivibrio soli]|uniref:GNAT family N-acetyltransferase n=1 Tax=Propionivibrio soli TaxID=2976531 RepID=UPI0021E9AC86|nr:GNAT family N-acetyltransferase [Propionivibrio soli]
MPMQTATTETSRPRTQRAAPLPSGIRLLRGYTPGLVGRLGELHGRYYAKVWGSGAPFEILITREICDFIEHYDPEEDLILSAHFKDEIIGSISMLGKNAGTDGVQLRFFIVDPEYHGLGAGSALLRGALDWCRDRGHEKVFLWTVDQLPESRHLYEKAGFAIVERHWDDRYTVPRENLKMSLTL